MPLSLEAFYGGGGGGVGGTACAGSVAAAVNTYRVSRAFFENWIAGVTHVPHEHWLPAQLSVPTRAPQPPGQASLPSAAAPPAEPAIHFTGSTRNSDEHAAEASAAAAAAAAAAATAPAPAAPARASLAARCAAKACAPSSWVDS